jgi:hypothetical protein
MSTPLEARRGRRLDLLEGRSSSAVLDGLERDGSQLSVKVLDGLAVPPDLKVNRLYATKRGERPRSRAVR